jgi:biopolymer transport protein ExbD
MNWKVRHEGSPEYLELPLKEIQQGLADGIWEPTDEVMGPEETEWQPMESHPALAEMAADLEPPPAPHHEDETRLDMTPLIDVCLVLLVFFMLTTTVAALQTRIEAPGVEQDTPKIKVVTKDKVKEQMIMCTAKMEDDRVVIRIEDKEVAPERLLREFQGFVKSTGKTTLLLQYDDQVPHEAVVRIIDSAKGAGMDRVSLVIPPGRP